MRNTWTDPMQVEITDLLESAFKVESCLVGNFLQTSHTSASDVVFSQFSKLTYNCESSSPPIMDGSIIRSSIWL